MLLVVGRLIILPCADSDRAATELRRALDLPRDRAAELGRSAVEAVRSGRYLNRRGQEVEIRAAVEEAVSAKLSLPPDAALPPQGRAEFEETGVVVANETTMEAGRLLVESGQRTLALSFGNSITPGGGFLSGARAQEEVLCRSSALFATLVDDAMYEAHRQRSDPAASDWAILSPDVPFFREDDGTPLEAAWRMSVVSCAAPVAREVGEPASSYLLRARIHRVLAIAAAYGYEAVVLGAWGCGAFGNDPARTALDFREALNGPFLGAFQEVVFAIADWSPERRSLGPFRDAFDALA